MGGQGQSDESTYAVLVLAHCAYQSHILPFDDSTT